MKGPRITGGRLVVATVAATVAGLTVSPVASAGAKAPGKPKLGAVKHALATKAARAEAKSLQIVSIGFDGYSGMELFVVKVDGRAVGMPFG